MSQRRAGRRFRAGHVLELGRHAYLSGDLEYDQGDDLEGPRGLFEAGWIF